VNHPWANRAAEHKPAQLAAAQRFGFLVPDTVITNNAREAREFVARQAGGTVYKPLWNTPYSVNGEPQAVWVREVYEDEITAAVEACPHMFQAKVGKAFDARVTAVDDQLFGVRIASPDLDWRYRQDLMHCTAVEVPESVAQAALAYLRNFQLTFGAFDFAVTAAGAWYFLECNPNGQWAWQPGDVTDRIAQAIADQLEKGPAT
jgi:glutathione synthase/RimK-type ligase-like ATP-grasp enzyme